jgi:hypothetical protein
MLIVWGVGLGLAYRLITNRGNAVLVLAALTVSHWLLDVVMHRPDLPLYPGSERFGLGLWNSVGGTLAIELPMFAAGVWIYARSTRARDGIGRWGFLALVAFLTVVYLSNLFGPPPPSVTAIAIVGAIGGAVLVLWAWWVDEHRRSG